MTGVLLSAGLPAAATGGRALEGGFRGPGIEYSTSVSEEWTDRMDLRQQLHDAMWVRVLFTLALLTGVLWVQIDHHGVVAGELAASASASWRSSTSRCTSSSGGSRRARPPRIIVVVDLALVTAAIVFAGGALSAERRLLRLADRLLGVFLPAWAPYAAAGGRQRRLRRRLGAPARRLARRLRARRRDPGAAQLDAHHRVPARRRLHARRAAQPGGSRRRSSAARRSSPAPRPTPRSSCAACRPPTSSCA